MPAFHSRKKILDCEGFDLRISDCAQIWDAAPESEVNASVPGAKANMIDFGSIHILLWLFVYQIANDTRLCRQFCQFLAQHGILRPDPAELLPQLVDLPVRFPQKVPRDRVCIFHAVFIGLRG